MIYATTVIARSAASPVIARSEATWQSINAIVVTRQKSYFIVIHLYIYIVTWSDL